ncbi:hypothetical protein QYF36_024219 [Acer negundo]|nr:hypothetical protein QYF36_024219 [Acer negundo]
MQLGTVTQLPVHPASPVLPTKNGPLRALDSMAQLNKAVVPSYLFKDPSFPLLCSGCNLATGTSGREVDKPDLSLLARGYSLLCSLTRAGGQDKNETMDFYGLHTYAYERDANNAQASRREQDDVVVCKLCNVVGHKIKSCPLRDEFPELCKQHARTLKSYSPEPTNIFGDFYNPEPHYKPYNICYN